MPVQHFSERDRPLALRSLTDRQVAQLHEATLQVLQRTGIRFFEDEAVELFRRGGATVDGSRVYIPPRLVEWALAVAPHNVTIYDRNGSRAMELGGYRSYFGVGSDCMYVYDLDTGQRRRAQLADTRRGVRLVDALPNLDFVMSMFMPSDAPEQSYETHQMEIMLTESTKPIVFVGIVADSTPYAIQMAQDVVGGSTALARRPFILNYVNTTTAFHHNSESVRRLLYAAERNVPTIYLPESQRGAASPMTQAGSMIVGNASQLAGLVLSQLKQEGAPFIRCGCGGGGLDMRSMVHLYASPEGGFLGWDLAHHYNLPIFGTAGCSDAKIFDAQAAAEAALLLFANALAGVNLIHDVGYLDSAMTGSLELVTFCDEIIGWIRRFMQGLEISEEALALDLINTVAPDGSFLETPHTAQHCRDDWRPTLLDRNNFNRWAETGATTLEARARAKARRLLEKHQAPPLGEDICARLRQTVARADQY